jgi:hypothetical protein
MTAGAMSLPVWVGALALAAIAPFLAKALGSMFETRSRERSKRLLAGAGAVMASDGAEAPDRKRQDEKS